MMVAVSRYQFFQWGLIQAASTAEGEAAKFQKTLESERAERLSLTNDLRTIREERVGAEGALEQVRRFGCLWQR